MRIEVRPPADLSAEERDAWDAVQRSRPVFDSPYYRPEWTDAVSAVRPNVQVAVISEDGRPVGFWPFEKSRAVARPVGTPMNDYQGAVLEEGVVVDTRELLAAAEVSTWEFDHLPAAVPGFADFHERSDTSPYLDLSGGFDAYLSGLSTSCRRNIKSAQRKGRKMGNEVGPVRFEADCVDPDVLNQVIAWKSAQYVRTGLPDLFTSPWTGRLLHDLVGRRDGQNGRLTGLLSALWAGDELVAAHMGLKAGPVVHWWFPTYSEDRAAYSPGLQLMVELTSWASDHGVTKIDLGKGMSDFKRRVMSAETTLAEGVIDHAPLRRFARRTARATKDRLRETPLRSVLARPAQWLFKRQVRQALS